MTLEQFQRLVVILANQGWVRYYLQMLPGEMVLELALLRGSPAPERLHQDLAERGMRALDCDQDVPALQIYRWAVVRREDARA